MKEIGELFYKSIFSRSDSTIANVRAYQQLSL